jgi:hypothetical protein
MPCCIREVYVLNARTVCQYTRQELHMVYNVHIMQPADIHCWRQLQPAAGLAAQ